MIDSNGVVSTYAGRLNTAGYKDALGTNALFDYPTGIALDGATNLYVADAGNEVIRRIAPGGATTTLAGTHAMAGSRDGNAALFNNPQGVAASAGGFVFVADTANNVIREITPGGEVTTVAGLAGFVGGGNGVASMAQFNEPIGLAVDSAGNVYVADVQNNAIRQGVPYYGQPRILSAPLAQTVSAGYSTVLTPDVAGADGFDRGQNGGGRGAAAVAMAFRRHQPGRRYGGDVHREQCPDGWRGELFGGGRQ